MTKCKARHRTPDEMQCACGLSWDIKDPEPPVCPSESVASEIDLSVAPWDAESYLAQPTREERAAAQSAFNHIDAILATPPTRSVAALEMELARVREVCLAVYELSRSFDYRRRCPETEIAEIIEQALTWPGEHNGK